MTIFYIILLTAFAYLAWRNIRYAIFVLLTTLPTYLLRFSLFNIPVTLLEGMILNLFVRWLTLKLQEKKIPHFDKLFVIGTTLFVASGIIGVIISPERLAALGIFKAYIIEPILFFLAARVCLSKRDLPQVITALSVSAVAVSLYGLAQRFLGVAIVAPWQAEL